MYRILIVDDEELFRKAVIQKIDWKSLGFDPVDEAEDGETALEAVRRNPPDVVLTDVRMPFMDGLELAKQLAADYPGILTVMLSGHDEFEYAQEALRTRVYEYLLKPIGAAALTELLKRLVVHLDAVAKEKQQMHMAREQLRLSAPILRERFFHRLLDGTLNDAEIARRNIHLEVPTDAGAHRVCVCQIDHPVFPVFGEAPDSQELLDFSASNIIHELVGSLGTVFNDTENRSVILLHGDVEQDRPLEFTHSELLRNIRKSLSMVLKNTWSIGIGHQVARFGDLSVSYRSAIEALSHRLTDGCDRIYDARDFEMQRTSVYFPAEAVRELAALLRLEEPVVVGKACTAFFQDLRSQPELSSENARIVLNDLVNAVSRTALETLGTRSVDTKELYRVQQQIAHADSLQQIEPIMAGLLSDICIRIRDQQTGYTKDRILRARQFIDRNFQDETLGLTQVAEHVSVSACYLSILFKREAQLTFIDYLTRVRMEKAKELLRTTQLKAYQIASQVGYSDPHYFSLRFKKHTGMNPTQYKDAIGGVP